MNKSILIQENENHDIQEEVIINQIIISIRSNLSGSLKSLDSTSEMQFYKYLNISEVDRCAFSYNWPYTIQATRARGYYYQSNQSIIYFYLRKNSNQSYPFTLVIVNFLGHDPQTLVYQISEAAKKLNLETIIKNVDRDKIEAWKNFGFRETLEPWSQYSFRDDNTYPEFVYDINKFINLEFSSRTRTLIRKISRETNYTFVPYSSSFRDSGLRLLGRNSEYLENKGVDFKDEVMNAHDFVFDENIRNKIVLAILDDDKLIGLSYLTHFGETLFFNAIINENKSNLMRFLLWKSVVFYCDNLEETQKPCYLALQGSENEGQCKWKVYFNPVRTIQRTHLTNR